MTEPIKTHPNATLLSLVHTVSKRKITDKDKIAYIKILLLKTILLDEMNVVSETNLYQREVKKSGNEFLAHLQKSIFQDRYENMFESDSAAVTEMEKSIEKLSNEIVDADLGVFSVMIECLKRYKENPDFIKNKLNIIVGDSEDIEDLEKREKLIEDIISLPFSAHAQLRPTVDGLKRIHT